MLASTSSTSPAPSRSRRSPPLSRGPPPPPPPPGGGPPPPTPPPPPPAQVSGEASPHHLTLTDDAVLSLDSRFKMNPPLRAESDRQALIEALRSGVIDCVATDHAPHARHEKEVPFEEAPMGTTGSETAFAVLYTQLVLPGLIPLSTLIERMTAGGGLYGLTVPRIAVGGPANLALVDLEATWTVGEDGYASRSENCCFAGRRLRGRVLLTVAGGAVAHQRPMLVPAEASTVTSTTTLRASR
jgi:dihydroorotase